MVEIVAFSINRIILNKDDDADRIVIGSIIIPKKKKKQSRQIFIHLAGSISCCIYREDPL